MSIASVPMVPVVTNQMATIAMAGAGVPVTPSITTQPTSQTVTAGQTATFSVTASGAAPLGYQWRKNGTAISGATSAIYTTPAAATSDSESQFTVVVSNSGGDATSNAATLTVNAAAVGPTITTQPASQTVTVGQTATLSVTASGAPPLNYLWRKNGIAISGATSASYTTPATATSDSGSQFNVAVSNSAGSVTSNAATLMVNPGSGAPLQITAKPLANAQVGIQYAESFNATGGVQPYHWSIASGRLPSGLSLNAASGMLSGPPSQGGQFDFSVQVSDSSSPKPQTAMKALMLSVLAFALQVTPGSLPSGQVGVPFQATITGNGGVTPYTWAVTGSLPSGLSLNASSGAIAGTPTQTGTSPFTIMLTDSAQQTAQKSSSITIAAVGVQPLAITTAALPNPIAGQAYSATFQATGGAPPYTWSVASGQLPSGLALAPASGQITGTSSQAGSATVSIQVLDSAGQTAQKSFTVTVSTAGPALPTLPQATVNLTMPTQTGTVWKVPAGDAATFQTDINSATCGDSIILVAGSIYSGNFTIPNKVCSGWLLIESSALASLPASGHRVGPSNAPNMAKVSTPNVSPAIQFFPSAHNWRLIGVEITTSYISTSNVNYNLVTMGLQTDNSAGISVQSQLPNFLIFDRIYIHGLPTTNTKRGIQMDGQYIGIVDSDCDEIHYNGNDSQCFASINGSGPFLIQNNFIQASAENILFGGGDPSIANLVPSDITIVGNLFQKNPAWRGQAAPLNWVVKNLFELKNAQRVLFDGNVLQYTWAAGQDEAIILRSVNQDGGCTWCVVQDVTVTHNLIQHAPMGIVIAGWSSNSAALSTARILVQNNVLDDISSANWGGHGWAFHLSPGGPPLLHDVTIDHNAAFPDTAFVFLGDSGTILGTQFTNNISNLGSYGIIGATVGSGTPALSTFAPGYIYNDMVFIGSASGTYPAGTFWNTSDRVGITNYAGANYQLTGASAYHNAGTDGKDIGVWDWTTFNTETTNALNGNYSH